MYNKTGIDKKCSKICGKELVNMAYRTSCATIVHEGGIHCETDIVADADVYAKTDIDNLLGAYIEE